MSDFTFPLGGAGFPVHPQRNLPLFTMLPNWKGGITERLSWLTDVMKSEAGVEQRRALRRFPRRSFEASFLRADNGRSFLDTFFTSIGRKEFLVPLWHEQFKLTGTQPGVGLVQFPKGTLQYREFRLHDMVFVTNGDPSKFTIVTVVGRDEAADRIELQHRDAATAWPQGTRIMPLRACRMLDAPQLGNRSDRVGVASVRFDLSDADASFTPSWGYCAPLWPFRPDRKTPVDLTFERSDYVLDMQGGVIDVTDPGGRAEISESMALKLFGRERVWAYRAFLHAARGRAVRFYTPSYTHDVQPTSNLGGRFFNAKVNGFSQYMDVPQEARRIIGIVFHDGAPTVYRNLVGVTNIADALPPYSTIYERYEVDADLPPIALGDIERIMFVMPSRFDQDTIELHHATDNSVAVASSVVMRSSVVAGMPPIECWVTSRPYPVDQVDAMTSAVTFTGGRMYDPNVKVSDSYTSAMVVSSGSLRSVLSGYAMEPEAYGSTMTITGGALRDVLRKNSMAPEALDISATMINGTLKLALITYERYPVEALDISATILEGTLT